MILKRYVTPEKERLKKRLRWSRRVSMFIEKLLGASADNHLKKKNLTEEDVRRIILETHMKTTHKK